MPQLSEGPTNDLISLIEESFDTETAKELHDSVIRDLEGSDEESGEHLSSSAIDLVGTRFYARVGIGRFQGLPQLTWNGLFVKENRPRFLYVPSTENAFRFFSPSLERWITPGAMDTDGGSTPLFVRVFSQMSPWYYGAAAIIHDWIFAAHRCGHPPDDRLSFQQAAMIAAEATKTLMEVGIRDLDRHLQKYRIDKALVYLVYKANTSPKARRIWDQDARGRACRSQTA